MMQSEKLLEKDAVGMEISTETKKKKQPIDFDDLPEDVKEMLTRKRRERQLMERTTVQKFEGKHVLTMLLYLNSKSPATKSDIYNNIAKHANMLGKLQDMYEMGLVEIYQTGRADSSIIMITPKGRKVAECINEAIDIAERS